MTEEKKHYKRKFLFNPLKRPLPYIGLVLAIVLFIFQQSIRNYVSDTIGDMLINSMKEATGGVYKATYDLVRFDIFSKELRINNLQIELDTMVISKEEYLIERPNLIHVNTPLIVVKLRSILPLLFNNQLYVSYVGALNPKFSLIKSLHSSVAKDATKNSQEDFRETINTYFAALEVDSFRVEKGSFKITTHSEEEEELNVIHIGEFTTMLKNFRLDSLSPSILLKGIRAQSFDLEIIDQDVNLPDLNQSIHFNKLSLSTTDSTFVLDSLHIKNIIQDETRNKSDLSINKLEILGFNFDNAFFKNELLVNEIRITNPNITFVKRNFERKRPDKSSTKSIFFESFNQLKINKIKLINGSIDFEAERKSKIQNLTLSISDYEINPEDWKQRKTLSNFKLQLLNAENIEQELPDSIHIAHINQVIYTSASNKAIISKFNIKPISGRNSYKLLKSRNTNFSTYSKLNSITLTQFNPEKLVLNSELDIDSIIIDKPYSSIVQYPSIKVAKNTSPSKTKIKFSINHFITNNGSIKVRRYQNKVNQFTLLNGIYFKSSSITESLMSNKIPSDYKLLISDGSIEIKNIGHTAYFKNLNLSETRSIFIEKAEIKPDSSTLPFNHIEASLTDVQLRGIDIEALENQSLAIDTFSVGTLTLANDFTRQKFSNKSSSKKNSLKAISIGDFNIKNSNIHIKQGNSVISVNDAAVNLNNILIDSLQTKSNPYIEFNNTVINAGQLSFSNLKDNIQFNASNAFYSESDSIISLKGLQFLASSKSLNLSLKEVNILGFNKTKLEANKELVFRKLEVIKPSILLTLTPKPDSIKQPLNVNKIILKGGLNKVKFDTLQIVDGESTVALSPETMLRIKSFKGIVTNYSVDTLTTIYEAVDQFKGVFELNDTYLHGLKDTLTISKLHLDTEHRYLWTDSIHFNTTSVNNILHIASPGIAIDHIDIPKLLENKIAIGRISTRNNFILLTQTDTTITEPNTKRAGFKMPLDISVEDINFVNTSFEYNKIDQPKHLLADLNFDIELDSLLAQKGHLFDIAKQTSDARFRTYNFTFDLPDSLNTIAFDTLLVSSGDEQVNISNLSLKGRYPKYEYGNQVGHQVDWKDLLIEKIKLDQIDFVELIENNTLKCQKLSLNKGHLDLFKDKQLPFPSDRVIPMLQERIKNIQFPVKIDSIELNNIDIFQTTLQSTGLQEGSISFINTSGLITNITNDSLRLANNQVLKVVASTQIMGSGNLYAEFGFDMLDEHNLFFFDARLGAMDAKAFNNILEATAHVSVKSGEVKSLNLSAKGNKSYAYGDMSFIYNNLKVETINKKTLEHKGMGKVLKTFFANAFVVKKNNSRIKFISRRGGMYYERDVSRITLDYVAKTALSGIVSSIGAKSNRKQIKQIQKDNKAARDLELKQQKELKKATKKKSR